MKLTESQKAAVFSRCADMIVSAGAGSGKTTVLTKRLIERIKSGDSVTDFLVVTFMNSAAADIKEKLYEALNAELAASPEDAHIYRQTQLITEANVCTISSFCLSLVRENFALLGISPKSRVIDETEKTMLLNRAADSLVTELYDSDDEWFALLVSNFSGDKGDGPLVEKMVSLYEKLRVMISPFELLKNCSETLRSDASLTSGGGFFSCSVGNYIFKNVSSALGSAFERAESLYAYAAQNTVDGKYLDPLYKLCDICSGLRIALEKGYSEFREFALDALSKVPKLYPKGCPEEVHDFVKEEKSAIVEELNCIKNRYIRGDDSFIAESFIKCADTVDAIAAFTALLDKRYTKLKKDSAVLDYADFERYALELLQTKDESGGYKPTELCLRKRKRFKEVLIDEYQDVNPMQDRLFTLLSGGGARFMVGDIKQSIYRFRNAYPDIFLGYKDSYTDYSPDAGSGAGRLRVLLRENFRCGAMVIDYVNSLFDCVTENSPFRGEYEGEWLIHASPSPEVARPVIIAVADREPQKAAEAKRDEAEFIAREIRRLVDTEYSNDGSRVKYSDIAVMLGAMKGYSVEYEKAFRKYGIPYRSESGEDFLANPVISLALSAMKAVDDPTDDISLCALLRSPICNFSSDELFRIRRNLKDTAFWNALTKTSLPKRSKLRSAAYSFTRRAGESGLCARCREVQRKLALWRHSAQGVPCGEFLNRFLSSTGLLHIAAASSQSRSLQMLYEYARRCESADYRGLSGFIDYLRELESGGRSVSDVPNTGNGDSVSFITVHKSKGLEYKVCFLAGAEKKFRFSDPRDGITLLRGEGVFFRLRDRDALTVYDPVCNIAARDKERASTYGEELRKLYVALTRAKERLYITGTAPKDRRERKYRPERAQSWLDLVLYHAFLGERTFFDLRDIPKSDGLPGFIAAAEKKEIIPTKEMLDAVEYEYPFASAAATAGKISVSELREGLLEDDEYNRGMLTVPASRVGYKPAFAGGKSTAADIGTANHVFMQFCDFKKVESDGVIKEADRLLGIAMITPEQRKLIDPTALEKFFCSDLYAEMRSSRRLYREKRFSVRDRLSPDGEEVLVQGVIDCFFENPDGTFTVVDYKTDRVREPRELIERHRVQLSCYRRAVERMTGGRVSRALLYSFALGKEAVL